MTNKSVEDQVFAQHQKIAELAQHGNTAKIALGEFLLWMREAERFKFVAGDDATWTSYLASPEVGIPYSSAARYMTIAKRFIHELGLEYKDLEGLDTWGLYAIANSKKVNKQTVRAWLDRVRTLSRGDLKQMLYYGEVDVMRCKHRWEKKKPAWKCEECGVITNQEPKS